MNQSLNVPQGFDANGIIQRVNQLRQRVQGDPMQHIQQMLNSGKVSQQQYNVAVQQAQSIMRLLGGK